MKKFSKLISLNLFIVWVLVILLAGIGTTIYANEQPPQDAENKEKIIPLTLEPGEVGKKYIKKLPAFSDSGIEQWEIQPQEKAKLPDGLRLTPNGYLLGTPTKEGEYMFELRDLKNNIIYEIPLTINSICQSENLRMISGYEISRASSSSGGEKGFIELYLSQPLPIFFNKQTPIHKTRPFRAWGNVRLTSIAQQNTKNIGTASSDYFSDLSDLKLNQMSQAAEFLVGLECNLWTIKSANKMYTYTLGLIAAAGGSTPLESEKDPQLVIYNMPTSDVQKNELKNRYLCTDDDFNGKNYISFAPEDRDRFYRQYYFGIRLKTYTNEAGISSLPAIFDATFGINDAASGGGGRFFNKAVFRLDGFLPFKILDVPIYIFGTVLLNTSKETIRKPLILGAPLQQKPTNSNEILIITEPANNRDFFKIGIGVDLYKVFMNGQENKKKEIEEKAKKDAKVEEEAENKTTK